VKQLAQFIPAFSLDPVKLRSERELAMKDEEKSSFEAELNKMRKIYQKEESEMKVVEEVKKDNQCNAWLRNKRAVLRHGAEKYLAKMRMLSSFLAV
jgi:hypothetical protein